MTVIHANRRWLMAMFAGVCLVGAAVGMAQRGPATELPHAANARELSSVFREVAATVLPGMVSIETRGKAVQVTRGFGFPFDEKSPFNDLFKNDPRFREFFKEHPEREQQFRTPRGKGSGFVIDAAGIIMTNSHVVRNAEEVKVRLQDGREFLATDVKSDPRSDVAIIRIDAPQDLQAVPLGNSDLMEIGDWVLAVGSPFGLDMTVTHGIISAKGRGPGINEREDYLQTDAAINPGNSGGPLVNLNGEVVAINTAISTHTGGSNGVGFAIPINMANWVAQQLIDKGEVKRAYLGVSIQPVSSDLAKKFGVPVGQGVIIGQIIPESPAAEADIQPGDVILELNGEAVHSPRNLQGIVELLSVEKSYKMTILRDGQRKTISVRMREMPQEFSLKRVPQPIRNTPDKPDKSEDSYEDLGIEIQQLTPELAKRLGDNDATGVVISAVKPNGPAHAAELRVGTIIKKVGKQDVNSPKEFREAMKNESLQDGILLFVRRGEEGTGFVVIQSSQ